MESFVKLFYILNIGDYEQFGKEQEDIERINSSHEFWQTFEENAHTFWKEALEITRKPSTTTTDMLSVLFKHIKNNFQMFKVNMKKSINGR